MSKPHPLQWVGVVCSKRDSLYAMIFAIDHVDAVFAVHNQRPGAMKLPGLAAGPAPAAERFAVFRELLHAVIAVFHDVKHALAIEGKVIGVCQFSRLGPLVAPTGDQVAVAREDLDALVAGVGDIKIAVRAQRQRSDTAELSRLGARTSPAAEAAALWVELADALVLAEFRDVIVAVAVLHGVTDVSKLAGGRAGVAAKHLYFRAVGTVNAQAVIVGIADQQVAVAVDAQAAGPAAAEIGRRPTGAGELAVT